MFVAGTQDNKIRAFDKESGEELWSHDLPFAGFSPPSTQVVNGRQYLVINASGSSHSFVARNAPKSARGDAFVAFALPDGKTVQPKKPEEKKSASKPDPAPVYAGWAFANKGEEKSSDAEKWEIVQQAGYQGFMGCKMTNPEELVQKGAVLPGFYFRAYPEKESFEQIRDRIVSKLPFISDDDGAIWLFFTGEKPRDAEAQMSAQEILKKLDAWAAEEGVNLYLYSHRGDQFYWRHSTEAVRYIEEAALSHTRLVFTVYHDRFGGFENQMVERLAAAADHTAVVALHGPEMINRREKGGAFYKQVFQELARQNFSGQFLIYSRPYSTNAKQYLKSQKAAFTHFQKAAMEVGK